MRFSIYLLLGLAFLMSVWASACRSVPKEMPPKTASYAMEAASPEQSYLAKTAQNLTREYEAGHSGFMLLDDSEGALKWRIALIDQAVKSLDILYYLWYGDESGSLLLKHVLMAADRGVRVRIMVDDLLMVNSDKTLVTLNEYPNMELRVFNPWYSRHSTAIGRGIEYLTKFKKLNHRLHNKLLVADNSFAIVGGRNLGDDYFGLNKKYNFQDMDLLSAGPVSMEVSSVFDYYWNSEMSYPASGLYKKEVKEKDKKKLRENFDERLEEGAERLAAFPMEWKDWSESFDMLADTMSEGLGRMTFDRIPDMKGVKVSTVVDSLGVIIHNIHKSLLISAAYYIPSDGMIQYFDSLTSSGKNIKLITNSMASNDVAISNSGYRKYRKPSLHAGIDLYELRMDAAHQPVYEVPPTKGKFLGLHAKTLVVDQKTVFIGSFNFDPRSLNINTEMGMIVEDSVLGARLSQVLERSMMPENAWRVWLNEKNKLRWTHGETTVKKQPARNFGQRIADFFFGILPIKQQL